MGLMWFLQNYTEWKQDEIVDWTHCSQLVWVGRWTPSTIPLKPGTPPRVVSQALTNKICRWGNNSCWPDHIICIEAWGEASCPHLVLNTSKIGGDDNLLWESRETSPSPDSYILSSWKGWKSLFFWSHTDRTANMGLQQPTCYRCRARSAAQGYG